MHTSERICDTVSQDIQPVLYRRFDDKHVPCLENRVAFQWEAAGDTLGHRHGVRRDEVVLGWLSSALSLNPGDSDRAYLDVGCAYGNHLLMLNAKTGKQNIEMIGIDLYDDGLDFAKEFARVVPGYQNCRFQAANLEEGLPFPDSTFNAVNLADVLEHMESPESALRELIRVTKPGGTIVVSTPLKSSIFKRLAAFGNRLVKGRLYRDYYHGKNTHLDENGKAVMFNPAGHDHISEMTYKELKSLMGRMGLEIEETHLMSVFSGSKFFDRHMFLLSMLVLVEGLHDRLKFPSWAHSICFKLKAPAKG